MCFPARGLYVMYENHHECYQHVEIITAMMISFSRLRRRWIFFLPLAGSL
jgi:hypothetical protein